MRILAVDDDPIILELLGDFVESMTDHVLVKVASPYEALDLIGEAPADFFDCFMLDIQMPGMNGIELCGLIRKTYADSPVLMLTAMRDKAYIDGAFSAGATDYITKPFEINELKTRLKSAENIITLNNNNKNLTLEQRDNRSQEEIAADIININDPLPIFEVDSVIDCISLENYVTQLSRSRLMGLSTFAFSIKQIQTLHQALTSFEFHCLITDMAEVISDALSSFNFFMSYVGNGTFVCVAENGSNLTHSCVLSKVNAALMNAEFYLNDGRSIDPHICMSQPSRLVWREGAAALGALGKAVEEAEALSSKPEDYSNLFWFLDRVG